MSDSCPQGHPFTEANTLVSRHGKRTCRVCARDRSRVWDENHREQRRTYKRLWMRKMRAAQK